MDAPCRRGWWEERSDWEGKVALIAGCTGAIDRFHAVVGAREERFVSFRLKDLDATGAGYASIDCSSDKKARCVKSSQERVATPL